jgi:hypothetical protein
METTPGRFAAASPIEGEVVQRYPTRPANTRSRNSGAPSQ